MLYKRGFSSLIIVFLVFVVLVIGGLFIFSPQLQTVSIGKKNLSNNSVLPEAKIDQKIAFIRDWNLWIYDDGVEKQLTQDGVRPPDDSAFSDNWYASPKLSPDKSKIAFLKYHDGNFENYSLYVINTDGTGLTKLNSIVEWSKNQILWSPDSRSIYSQNFLKNDTESEYPSYAVNKISVLDQKEEQVGSYTPISGGCGGGGLEVADGLALHEGLSLPGFGSPTFELSKDGSYILLSTNCMGSELALLNLKDKKVEQLNAGGYTGVFSSDGKKMAIAEGADIIVYETSSLKVLEKLPMEVSDLDRVSLVFSPDDSQIYYKTTTVTENYNNRSNLDLLSFIPYFTINKISLKTLGFQDQKNNTLLTLDGHDLKFIGMTGTGDGELIISLVENAPEEYKNIKTKEDLVRFLPKVDLIKLSPSNKAELLIRNAQQADTGD